MSTLQITINGTNRSSIVDWKSLILTDVLTKEVDRLEFTVLKNTGKIIPALNDEVVLLENGVKLFGGLIVELNEKMLGGLQLGYEIKCKDWSVKLDGKLVTKSYENQTARAILLDVIASFTTGFTTTNVKASTPTVASLKFNYEQVSRAFTLLADRIGWDWYVDGDKDIHFFDEESAVAPFILDDSTGNFEWDTLEINQTVVNLKNHIFVRGGDYKKEILKAAAIDKYVASAGQKTFHLAYMYDDVTVEVNNTIQTLGTDQQTDPLTVQCLYNFNEKFITFPIGLTGGESVVIYGKAYIPIIASVRDQISIKTYGEFQYAKVDKSILSIGEAQSLAKQELKKYSASVHEAKFKTTKTGLKTGQQITLNSPIRGWNKTFKINRIAGKARGSDHMEYDVSMLASGEITFTDIMVGLLSKDNQNIDIASNEVLQRLELFYEEIGIAEVVTTTKKVPPYKWGLGSANDGKFNFATWK